MLNLAIIRKVDNVFNISLALLSPLRPLRGHKASMIFLHLDLSWATCWASPHVRAMSFSSVITVHCHDILGQPGLGFPSGVCLSAAFAIRYTEDIPKPSYVLAYNL